MQDLLEYDENGKIIKVTSYHENNNVKSETNFKDEKIHGWVKKFYENGNLESESQFIEGKLSGKMVCYEENEIIKYDMLFNKGLLNGAFNKYLDGQLQIQINYLDGKKHGDFIYYASNNNIKQIAHYENDTLTGETKNFDENTNELVQIENYKAGKKNGLSLIYYPNSNGKVFQESYYENDLLEGFMKRFHLTGAISELTEYKKGKATGAPLQFNEQGEPLDSGQQMTLNKKSGFFDNLFAK